jgi:uncharacterized protein
MNLRDNIIKMKEKNNKIRFLENSMLVDNEILVFSDFHIGYEEYLYGRLIPIRAQLEEIIKNLERIFILLHKDNIKVKEIVILGDLKHEFGEISDSEWRETLLLLDYLLLKCKKIILIKGNHDNILGSIAKKREIVLKDFYCVDGICFLHGDKWFEECENCKTLIVGHLHPAISLVDNYKKEKFKCFLHGKWKGKEIYVLPSFVPLVFGYDILNREEKKDFFIIDNSSLEKFNVIIYNEKEDKEYNFGKLGKMMK